MRPPTGIDAAKIRAEKLAEFRAEFELARLEIETEELAKPLEQRFEEHKARCSSDFALLRQLVDTIYLNLSHDADDVRKALNVLLVRAGTETLV